MSPIPDPSTGDARHHRNAVSHETIHRRVGAALAAAGASPDQIDEISQAAVVEAWVRDAAIRDRDKVVSYAVTIAMRHLAAERRMCARLSPLTARGADLVDESDLGVWVERAELGELVMDALMQLTERDRYLVLGSLEGLDIDTMAAATGLKRESVATSACRARKRLRAHLVDRSLGADGLAA